MASTTTFLALSLLFSLISLSSSLLPSSTILDAAEILSGSGFEAMALNLELASHTLAPPQTRSLTIFSPKDLSFKEIPHLPLSLLRYHLLPHAFSLHSLSSLPFGANIPTLLPSHSLTITTTTTTTSHSHSHSRSHSHHRISINNVTVNPSPVFDDGRLVIFETDSFFDPFFQLPTRIPACFPARENGATFSFSSLKVASVVLRSRGCSVMASILDMQFLLGFRDRPQLTIFSPIDEVMVGNNLSDYSSILRHHIVPCKILWSDLVKLDDGTLIWTYERGFVLNITKPRTDTLLINEVPVIFPDLYHSDWLVVHGLPQVLSEGRRERVAEDSVRISAEEESSFGMENHAGHHHFSVFH